MLEAVGASTSVPLANGTWATYANLDLAASAPALRAVADRVNTTLQWYASVHRGAGYLSQVSTSLYEAARLSLGAFVGARPDDEVLITRNTTDSINLLARSVPGRILVLDIEHHANLLPWQAAAGGATVLNALPTQAATIAALEDELAVGDYALLAVTGASNVTGEILPLAQVAEIAHSHGARLFVDAAQLAPHRPIDIAATGVDYVALSGHKLYAPYGAGALIGRIDWLDDAEPYLRGGGAVTNVTTRGAEWQRGVARHEAGSPNVIGAVALATAAETLQAVGFAALQAHEAALVGRLHQGLATIPGVRVARIWEDSADRVAVVTFALAGLEPGFVAAYLSAEHGIGVRDGRFCAHPLLRKLGLDQGAVRASVGASTTGEHVERLIAAVRWLATGQPIREYEVRDGAWTLRHDTRPIPSGLHLDHLIDTAAAGCTPAVAPAVAPAAGCTPATEPAS
nr:aminotransferase class V-fold PLP-dependent enzyme [Rarobacter incanus]